MKMTFILNGVDCAVCAGNLENAINKLDYIKKATVDFVNLKLFVETNDDVNVTESELQNKLQIVTTKVLFNVTLKNAKTLDFIKHKKQNFRVFDKSESIVTSLNMGHEQISDEKLDLLLEELNKNNSLKLEILAKEEKQAKKFMEKNKYKINFLSFQFIKLYLCLLVFILAIFLPINFYIKLALYIVSYLIVSYDVIYAAIKNIFKGKFLDEKFLMSLASIAAFGIGEYPEAVMVMLLYQIGELFSDNAVKKTRHAINEIINLKPEEANLIINGEIQVVEPESLQLGNQILIKVGEKVPTDVKIIKGESNFDVSSVTGESMPLYLKTGNNLISGSINLTNAVTAEVVSEFKDSTVSKIMELVENNGANKSKAENFITKFAKYYTPIVVLIAIILFAFFPLYGSGVIDGIKKAAVFLVISCPCALVISVPLTYFCGLGISARKGLLIKGANVLDNINNLKAICFDKTGTLTYGKFVITEINTISGSENDLIYSLTLAESVSDHPIAKCITENKIIDSSKIKTSKEILGHGIIIETTNGDQIACGNEKLMKQQKIIFNQEIITGTIIYVAKNKNYLGYVVINDKIKENSKQEIEKLNSSKIKTIMLTGDNKATADYVSYEVGVSETYSSLLPQDKVEKFNDVLKTYGSVGFVGDGVNDAPVLSSATVGYSMGLNGSDSAIELSDVVIMTDNINAVNNSITIAKRTRRIATQNIVFSLLIKFGIMILSVCGFSNMYLAIFADVGVSILAILNAIRIFRTKLK